MARFQNSTRELDSTTCIFSSERFSSRTLKTLKIVLTVKLGSMQIGIVYKLLLPKTIVSKHLAKNGECSHTNPPTHGENLRGRFLAAKNKNSELTEPETHESCRETHLARKQKNTPPNIASSIRR